MFTDKKTQLIDRKVEKTKKSGRKNRFLFGGERDAAITVSGNGAKKYSTTGNNFVDQFGKLGTYKTPRPFNKIAKDCAILWEEDQDLFVRFTIYTRMISRKTEIFGLGIKTQEPQSGAELKHEAIMRMIWLSQESPETFWKNIGLFISAGSCKDIITMLKTDLVYHGWEDRKLNWTRCGNLILTLLDNTSSVNLMKKYLPQIKANSQCNTVESQANNIIGKWICSLVFGGKTGSSTYKKYRCLKNSGNAHEWQQLISQRQFDKIDFGKIHGRALSLLVKGKFLKNQGLSDRYSEWISKQETVKCTGFVHEILCELDFNTDKNFVSTVNKQFAELVSKAKGSEDNLTKLIVVRDTSASMLEDAIGAKFSSNAIATALGIYFSEFLTGEFENHWIEFANRATLRKWNGKKPSTKYKNDRGNAYGTTNFQDVIDLFCKMKRKGTLEEDFPNGILCISDGEFNSSSLEKTNVAVVRQKLKAAGFSPDFVENFKIVLWNIPNNFHSRRRSGVKFETFGDVKNVFYLSGYSASNVKFILNNKVETAEDLLNAAMDQELLNLIEV